METHKTVPGAQYVPPTHYMREEPKGIVRFTNRVQGLAYGGAAALVVIIGLRSIYGRNIPTWIVIGALLLEACLLLMIATVYYLTPEEKGGAAPSTETQILTGEKEILNLIRKDIIPGENEMIRTQREISGLQREMLDSHREMYAALREDLQNGNTETVRVLQQIESNINKIVEREIERVVQEKVQEVFTSMVRQEVHKSLETHRNKVA